MIFDIECNIDGASRGNPGEAGVGIYIRDNRTGKEIKTGKYLGKTTNNYAEYMALILLLDILKKQKLDSNTTINVVTDSNLVVMQIRGTWKIKHKDMQELHRQATDRIKNLGIKSFTIVHNYREQNQVADSLANLAIDKKMNLQY